MDDEQAKSKPNFTPFLMDFVAAQEKRINENRKFFFSSHCTSWVSFIFTVIFIFIFNFRHHFFTHFSTNVFLYFLHYFSFTFFSLQMDWWTKQHKKRCKNNHLHRHQFHLHHQWMRRKSQEEKKEKFARKWNFLWIFNVCLWANISVSCVHKFCNILLVLKSLIISLRLTQFNLWVSHNAII